jgi:hypothetical protein
MYDILFLCYFLDTIKMSEVYQKNRHFTAGIIGATVGLGVVFLLRKYGGNKIKQFLGYGARELNDRVVVVNSFRECEVVGEKLIR